VADGINKGASEDGGEKVAEGITLLKHTGNDAAGGAGAVFESYDGISCISGDDYRE
jgi:hypothetical protein